MLTEIERLLFRKDMLHFVVELTLAVDRLVISVAPLNDLTANVTAEFLQARIDSIDLYANSADELNLPWQIVGFDSRQLDGEKWKFVVHCDGIEYGFTSIWPRLLA